MSRALLLIGSPKPGKSASRTFAEAVGSRLESRGLETRVERVAPSFRDELRLDELLDAIAAVRPRRALVPGLRRLAARAGPAPARGVGGGRRRRLDDRRARRRLAVLTQCGFPEASHCQVAIEVCRLFAEKTGVAWAGALAFGMGGSIEGGSVEQSPLAGRLGCARRGCRRAGRRSADSDVGDRGVRAPARPSWTYPLLGGWMWSRQAKKRGCTEPLTLKRYTA